MLIVLSVLWGPTIFPPCTCTVALKQSQGDPNRCGMVVLSWVHQGLFSLKVISSRSHITTHFDVIAYSCGWPISERRSLVDIWERAWPYFHLFKVLLVQCNLGDTTIKNHNIRKTSESKLWVILKVYWCRAGTKRKGVTVGIAVMTDGHTDHWLSFKQHTLIPNSPDTAAWSGLKLQTMIVRLRLQNYLVRFEKIKLWVKITTFSLVISDITQCT